jgi:predicted neutral ceramidase superfamily lipid hydrolase
MSKNNSPKSQYNDIIKKQPPKIIKASKFMNIVTIVCAVLFVTLLVLKWTNVFIAPPLLLWSPVIVFGAFFLVIVVWMMKVMLTEGLVTPMNTGKSSNNYSSKNASYNRPNMTHGHGKHSATKKKRKHKKK